MANQDLHDQLSKLKEIADQFSNIMDMDNELEEKTDTEIQLEKSLARTFLLAIKATIEKNENNKPEQAR